MLLPLLTACGLPLVPDRPPAETPWGYLQLDRTSFDRLPGWKGDKVSDALPAFLKSCAKLKTLPPDLKLKPKLMPSRI